MNFRSTRGQVKGFSFEDAVMQGLAPDGGLFIPESIPQIPSDWQDKWADHSFEQLAYEIISLYVGDDEIPADDLRDIIERSYATFDTRDVTPLVKLDEETDTWVLELFHGPTFAFKDVALQFLGNLFKYFLDRRNVQRKAGEPEHRLSVLGATSGDTGSAAIYGLRGKSAISVFMLFPKGRVSPIQEAQMTTITDKNVHTIAVDGTFDDCQAIVKELFGREEFRKANNLCAVNSINWARIMAQIIYYFHTYLVLTRAGYRSPRLAFVVPTGNFGDVLAGFYAHEMGLPVSKLVVATNSNDILDRFFRTGRYEKNEDEGVLATTSPAMDILVSSNFERLMWYIARDYEVGDSAEVEAREDAAGQHVRQLMDDLKTRGKFSVSEAGLAAATRLFASGTCRDATTIKTIRKYYHAGGSRRPSYLLDPHTAVGIYVAETIRDKLAAEIDAPVTTVCLSTAHPAKFIETVSHALEGISSPPFDETKVLPPALAEIIDEPRRCLTSANSADSVADLVVKYSRCDDQQQGC